MKPPDVNDVVDLSTLLQFLRYCFTPAKAGHKDDPTLLQARYVAALGGVAQFLARSGADEGVCRRMLELASAIDNLRNGTVADVLRPTSFGGGRGPDSIATWSYRGDVVMGLEFLRRSGKSLPDAAEYIEKRYPILNKLKRDAGDSLKEAILAWRKSINGGKAPISKDALATQESLFRKHGKNRSQKEFLALGEQLLKELAGKIAV
jgi:hypothetical protein